jgi:ATP-binding protein involved in chromosome partitioning
MSCYVCRHCQDTVYLFGKDKGKELAKMMEIPFLGSIPLDPLFSEAADTGIPIVDLFPDSITAKAFSEIAQTLAGQLPPKEVAEAPPMEESKPCPGSHQHGPDHYHRHHHHHDHGHGESTCCGHLSKDKPESAPQ